MTQKWPNVAVELNLSKSFDRTPPPQQSTEGEGEFHLLIGELEQYHGLLQPYFRTFRTVQEDGARVFADTLPYVLFLKFASCLSNSALC